MTYKYIIVIVLILVSFFALSSIYAVEDNNFISQTENFIDETKSSFEELIGLDTDEDIKDADVISVKGYDELYDEIIKYNKNDNMKPLKIILEDGDYNITKTIGYSTPDMDKKLIIDGCGHHIDGNAKYQFMLLNNASVSMKNTVIENTVNDSKEGAGCFVMISPSTLNLENCSLKNNKGSTKGSVVTNRGNTTIKNCEIINNTVDNVGGAVWSTGEYGGSIIVEDNIFKENNANSGNNHERTGIIYIVSGGTNKIDNNLFEDNDGRCIHCYNYTNADICHNTFRNNHLEFNDIIRGGIIDNYESDVKIYDNVFEDDYTHGQLRGGILYHEIGKLEFYNNTVNDKHLLEGKSSTSTCSKGGVIFNRNATADIHDNIFSNTMTGNYSRGGVLYNNLGNVSLDNNIFKNILNGDNIEGLSAYNDVNGIINVKDNQFNSTCIGSCIGLDKEMYIYNSNHPNTEGSGTHGITNYN